jgi:hypothetical protein
LKIKLSKKISPYIKTYSDIEKFFLKNEATEQKIAEYSALTMIPIYAVYVYLIQIEGKVELSAKLKQLCEYYQLDNDLIA